MNSSAAVAAVYSVIKGVDGTGPNVYDQLRFTNDPIKFDEIFVDTQTVPGQKIIHTWMVTRESSKGADETMQAASDTHQIVAAGYRGFQDDVTEPLWQAEIDAIVNALLPLSGRHLQAEGENIYFDWSGPPQVEAVRLVWFGKYLCHTARIIHPVKEYPL